MELTSIQFNFFLFKSEAIQTTCRTTHHIVLSLAS